jgi:hypothetical protein
MKRDWTANELVEHFGLTADELTWVGGSAPHNVLGLAVLLKTFQYSGHFPAHPGEVAPEILAYLAQQVQVPVGIFGQYDWNGRTASRHRRAIRERTGFREVTVEDVEDLAKWLAQHPILLHDHQISTLKDIVYGRCRDLHIEPPTSDRIDRTVRSAVRRFEEALFERICQALPERSKLALDSLVDTDTPEEESERSFQHSTFLSLKSDPARLSVSGVLAEVEKLEQLQAIELPVDLFAHLSPKLIAKYCQRAAAEPPRELRNHPLPIKYALLAAFCWQRRRKVTDNLVELLIQIVHKINAKAEHRVESDFVADIKRVRGKQAILFRLAEAALANPDGVIKDVLYPIVDQQTLRDLVDEFRASGANYHSRVYHVMRASYSHHYRRILPHILRVLTFRSNNTHYHPVIDALEVLKTYIDSRRHYYPQDVNVPIDDVVRSHWQPLVVEKDEDGRTRVNRINYEVSVLHTLRNRLRSRQIWVKGADRYRNPDTDTPADFVEQRPAYYQALNQPLFDSWIKVTPLSKQIEPPNLRFLKAEVSRTWPMTSPAGGLQRS